MILRSTPVRSGAPVALALLLVLLVPSVVAGHAELLEMTPQDGATVAGTPAEISATFSEPLDPDRSTFSLRNAAGERLAIGGIDPADPARLVIDPVPQLEPGAYEVRWAASGADAHLERDTWSFAVEAAAATPARPSASASVTPSQGATPSASASPAVTPSLTATPSGPITPPSDPVGSTTEVFLPIIAGLAIVIAGAAFLLSRRGRPSDGT